MAATATAEDTDRKRKTFNDVKDPNYAHIRVLMQRPFVAWPTVLLFCFLLCLWLFSVALGTGALELFLRQNNYVASDGNHYAFARNILSSSEEETKSWLSLLSPEGERSMTGGVVQPQPSWKLTVLCLILSSVASFGMFTVLHDSAHRSVSQVRFLNDLFGSLSMMFLGPFVSFDAFRWVHLRHHKYTNDPQKDPDMWASRGSGALAGVVLPLKWASPEIHYYYSYLPILFTQRPKSEILTTVGTIFALVSMTVTLSSMGYFSPLFQFWILPSRIAIFFLAFSFDYLPHQPHSVTNDEDRFRTTFYLSSAGLIRPFLSLVMLYQNYHVIHHLYPLVPFYRYKQMWHYKKDSLIYDKDVPFRRLFRLFGEEDLSDRRQASSRKEKSS
ncbi:Delta(12)-fatty acid dehydrogenase [Balamuthia mandrillaris]